jgi:Tol biopolymer transport system component
MKRIYLFLGAFQACFIISTAQDMFNARQLTFDPVQEGFATWSPDGKRIAFNSTRSGNHDIWIMEVDIEKIKKEL